MKRLTAMVRLALFVALACLSFTLQGCEESALAIVDGASTMIGVLFASSRIRPPHHADANSCL